MQRAQFSSAMKKTAIGGRPRGQVRIDVTFEISSDGLVNVTACDKETGEQASTAITLNSGLSKVEMDEILGESPADRVESETYVLDEQQVQQIQRLSRSELDSRLVKIHTGIICALNTDHIDAWYIYDTRNDVARKVFVCWDADDIIQISVIEIPNAIC